MSDETQEERDVAEAQTAVAEAVRRGDDFMRVNGYVRALESAIEARTLAKLRAGVPRTPATIVGDSRLAAAVERYEQSDAFGALDQLLHDVMDIATEDQRAALAKARERAERLEAERDEAQDGAWIVIPEDGVPRERWLRVGAAMWTSAVAERDVALRLQATWAADQKKEAANVDRLGAERDDARARLAEVLAAVDRVLAVSMSDDSAGAIREAGDARIALRRLAEAALVPASVPLTMTAEQERELRAYGTISSNAAAAEIDATRDALAEARERAERLEVENELLKRGDFRETLLTVKMMRERIRELEAERDAALEVARGEPDERDK